VLVRTRDLGTIGDAPASLSVFNHAIVYVPKYDLYMDGTAEHSGAFELPAGDQGASVLIVKDGSGGEFRTIPYDPPSANNTEYTQKVVLAADGNAKVEHTMSMVGVGASAWRATLESEGQRKELLTKQLAGTFPGTIVDDAEFPGITDVLAPVTVKAELSVPNWAQPQDGTQAQGKGLRFRLLGHEVQLARGVAAQTKREHPLVLGVPNREVRNIEYELPRGLEFSQVPKPARVDSPFGSFELKVDAKGRTAVITTSIEFARARIEPGEYQAFREFLREVDAALAQAFEAQPAR